MKKVTIAVLAGIIGTALMSLTMMIAVAVGMPKMSPPNMLSDMMAVPISIGWVMHFMIGIVFAFAYTFFVDKLLKIGNTWLKGALFGIIVFIFAQIAMAMMPMPPLDGSILPSAIGGIIGHVIFGIVIAISAGNTHCSKKSCKTNQ